MAHQDRLQSPAILVCGSYETVHHHFRARTPSPTLSTISRPPGGGPRETMPVHLGEVNSIPRCVPRFAVNLSPDGPDSEGKHLNITIAGEERQHISTYCGGNTGGPNGKVHWLRGSLKAQSLGGELSGREVMESRTWQRERKAKPTEKGSCPQLFHFCP